MPGRAGVNGGMVKGKVKGRRCLLCGREAEIENLCRECYQKLNPILQGFKEIGIRKCPVCGRVLLNGRWVSAGEDSVLRGIFERGFRIHDAFKDIDYDYEMVLPKHQMVTGTEVFGHLNLRIRARGVEGQHSGKISFSEEYVLPLKLKYSLCDSCSIKKTRYYQAVLQLRFSKERTRESEIVLEQILDFIIRYFEENKRKGVFITKQAPSPDGIDIYITSNKYAINLARKISHCFGAELKINERIFGRSSSGKDIYRVTVLIRVPMFARDSIVAVKQRGSSENRIIRVVHAGRNLLGENLENGKRVTMKMSDASHLSVLEKRDCSIIKFFPSVEVLHPDSFQAVEPSNLENPRIRHHLEAVRKSKKDFSAKIVVFGDRVYLI